MQTKNLSAESYSGVKFTTVFKSTDLPGGFDVDRFMYWCRQFGLKGVAPEHETGSFGNMSCRISDSQFIVTRTSASLTNISKEDFVCVDLCDLENFKIEVHGEFEPSSETFIHAELYKALPNVMAIFHGHSDEILNMANVPVTSQEIPYGTIELMEAALKLKDKPVFNLKNHGFFSLGATMDEAGEQIMSLL